MSFSASLLASTAARSARTPWFSRVGWAAIPVFLLGSALCAGTSAHAQATAEGSGIANQAIVLPKGQGSIEGLGESFSTQPSTGQFSYSVPIATPKARGRAQPGLTLSYSSGDRVGVAGTGWDLPVPSIARQTDRGVPGYLDSAAVWNPAQDRFIFNGGQELVPLGLVSARRCKAAPDEVMPSWAEGWQYFRPRVEGGFARFFWSPDHRSWRVQNKDGTSLELGVPLDGSGYTGALQSDPSNAARIYRWNLVRSYDNEGATPPAGAAQPAPSNPVVYRYSNQAGVSYLSDVYDTPPASSPSVAALSEYAHHVHLTYEARTDVRSSFRPGWQTTTSLRLKRVDVSSRGTVAVAGREMVRRYHLAYESGRAASLLSSVQLEGRCDDAAIPEGANELLPESTRCPRMPPMTFAYSSGQGSYSSPELGTLNVKPRQLVNSPGFGIDASTDFVDVDGDGLKDFLLMGPMWFSASGRFAHVLALNGSSGTASDLRALTELINPIDSPVPDQELSLERAQLLPLDLDGDGLLEFLLPFDDAFSPILRPQRSGNQWIWGSRWVPTPSGLAGQLRASGRHTTRMLDVNGDGLPDLVAPISASAEYLLSYLNLGRYPGGDGQYGTASWTSDRTALIQDSPLAACRPGDDYPINLADPNIQTADMNGDGLADLVEVLWYGVRYWPGRGDGSFGLRPSTSCGYPDGPILPADIQMADAPTFWTQPQPGAFKFADVNGDGLDDLVITDGIWVEIYVNLDGLRFTSVPLQLSYSDAQFLFRSDVHARIADLDGSGVSEIVWGGLDDYRVLDLMGGKRANLLTVVRNGLGKQVDIEYASSTELMLEAQRAGKPWSAKMPLVVWPVRRVTESDGLSVAGRPPSRYVTEYTYRDPVYDGRQREFRGFKEVVERHLGDQNGPPSNKRILFLTGDCQDETPADGVADCEPSGRWRDNGREALKGLPVITETYDDQGVFLSTSHSTYTLRHLFSGLDGRAVRHAFESRSDTWLYDTDSFSAAESTVESADTVLEGVGGSPEKTSVRLRSSAGRAHIASRRTVDRFGNETETAQLGCVDGCPADEPIVKHAAIQLASGDVSGWLWVKTDEWVDGASAGERRSWRSLESDARGRLVATRAHLSGTLPLDRFHEAGEPVAPAPAETARDGIVLESAQEYDSFGNLVFSRLAGHRCRKVEYDSAYAIFPEVETLYAGRLGADAGSGTYASSLFSQSGEGAACGQVALATRAAYDRGLERPLEVTSPRNEKTVAHYDGFGRLTELYNPHPVSPGVASEQPSVTLRYDIDSSGKRPYSIITTRAADGLSTSDTSARESAAFVDGLGRAVVVLEQADPTAGDGGSYIASGLTDYDQKGNPKRQFLPWFTNQSASTFSLASPPPTASKATVFDAFGRAIRTVDFDGVVEAETHYHALSTDIWDRADLSSAQHRGTYQTVVHDGHGRTRIAIDRLREDSTIRVYQTETSYLATGEPLVISRRPSDGSASAVVRWMRYDSLGRRVLNAEPNVSAKFNPDPAAPASSVRAPRYAYDNAGRVVGTSDARGCGVNFFFDAAGRKLAEDYSPCQLSQLPYSSPDLATGSGTETFATYDAPPPEGSGCAPSPVSALGRLSSTSSRGALDVITYDGRGRPTCVSRRVAKPGPTAAALADRYALGWFTSQSSFDAADRPTSVTTGAASPELMGADRSSAVTTTYSKRGLIRSAGSSYGELVSSVVREADGKPKAIQYGDLAQTRTALSYDSRQRLQRATTSRAAPAAWSQGTGSYVPPSPSDSPTQQKLLEDSELFYDEVGNPTDILDHRDPGEWPVGAQPVHRSMGYDSLYRLTSIQYLNPGQQDGWVSPFAAENAGTSADPRRGMPSPHVAFEKRAREQGFSYDWLGNTSATSDDARGFYDRSLGTITNGAAAGKPYQLLSASNVSGTAPAGREGWLQAKYDDAGNMVGLAVVRAGPCLPSGAICTQRFAYEWDEVGNLARARRWDLPAASLPSEPEPTTPVAVELRNLYDNEGDRVVKTAVASNGSSRHTVYALPSLELRGATYAGNAYERTARTEVPYLFAHGVRLARVVYAIEDVPFMTSGGRLHVFLRLEDHLGSVSTVIDLASGELVERSTYLANGAADSDYRPVRWRQFREDYRFTGKEEDVEVGLQYFGKRFYAPSLGRWISPDPAAVHALQADLNLYAYVHGRVFIAVDVAGLDEVSTRDRVVGGLRFLGGALGAVGSTALLLAPEPTGATKVVGAIGLAYNVDAARAGWKQFWHGGTQETVTQQVLRQGAEIAGASPELAEKIGHAGDTVLGVGLGVGTARLAAAAVGPARAAFEQSVKQLGREAGREASLASKIAPQAASAACFVAGTLVWTPAGARSIETLKVGDQVLSKDETTGRVSVQPVLATVVRRSQVVLRLGLEKEDGRLDELRTTQEHPFWLRDTGWTVAGDLLPGDQVADGHGGWLRVHSSTWEQERADVFNLAIGKTQTYFVGESAAWVHNKAAANEAPSAAGEIFYRAMSARHWARLNATGRLPATGETFTSFRLKYASQYDGVLVKFTLKPGTTEKLAAIGVSDGAKVTTEAYPGMPVVEGAWTAAKAYFKTEDDAVNIGLGKGAALELFNDNILGFAKVVDGQ